MTYIRSYEDLDHESDKIWGHHWQYIIEGTDVRILKRPFNMQDIQITDTNYGQGGPIVYVDQRDELVLAINGYLPTHYE
jgi:5-methylcytosine-specific restriction enzyme A